MTEMLTISKHAPETTSMDWNALRELGLQHIEQFASKLWTDYNTHDPGITIMEMLCYAITDLGYRTNQPIQDLISTKENNFENFHEQFLSAIKVLPTCPVSEIDYRKLFIDIKGVRNAWLFKHNQRVFVDCRESKMSYIKPAAGRPKKQFKYNGIYNIQLELESDIDPRDKPKVQEIFSKVRSTYHRNRNLGEDLERIQVVPQHNIMLCADIDIVDPTKAEEIYATVLAQVQQYLTPPVHWYTLQELLDEEIPTDQIYDGPVLQHGFIRDEELTNSKLKQKVYVSDLVNIIMSIDGVRAIKKISLNHCDPKRREAEAFKWCMDIDKEHQPNLCKKESALRFFVDVLPVEIKDKQVVIDMANQLSLPERKQSADLPMPLGKFIDAENYSSVVNDFPLNYGIGEFGIAGVSTTERKNLAKQLKGYLLFFDQILANYCSQLWEVRNLFKADATVKRTYFSQTVNGIRDMKELIHDHENWTSNLQDLVDSLEDWESNPDRKHRFLNHLMARFNEQFADYVLLQYSLFGEKSHDEMINDKAQFIRAFEHLSKCRARGFDYFNELNEDGSTNKFWYETSKDEIETSAINVSGFAKRAGKLAGVNNLKRRELAAIKPPIKKKPNSNNEFHFELKQANKTLLKTDLKSDDEQLTKKKLIRIFDRALQSNVFEHGITPGGKHFFRVLDEEGKPFARSTELFKTKEEKTQALDKLLHVLNEELNPEGIFVVEHILLRPDPQAQQKPFFNICVDEDCTHCDPLDPYSFRISIILPGYTLRFSNTNFRVFFEKLLRKECPAHILPRICWIGEEHMALFEKAYKSWLQLKRGLPNDKTKYAKATEKLIQLLGEIHTIYPEGTLHDCHEDVDENPIVLGRTNLGTIENNES